MTSSEPVHQLQSNKDPVTASSANAALTRPPTPIEEAVGCQKEILEEKISRAE